MTRILTISDQSLTGRLLDAPGLQKAIHSKLKNISQLAKRALLALMTLITTCLDLVWWSTLTFSIVPLYKHGTDHLINLISTLFCLIVSPLMLFGYAPTVEDRFFFKKHAEIDEDLKFPPVENLIAKMKEDTAKMTVEQLLFEDLHTTPLMPFKKITFGGNTKQEREIMRRNQRIEELTIQHKLDSAKLRQEALNERERLLVERLKNEMHQSFDIGIMARFFFTSQLGVESARNLILQGAYYEIDCPFEPLIKALEIRHAYHIFIIYGQYDAKLDGSISTEDRNKPSDNVLISQKQHSLQQRKTIIAERFKQFNHAHRFENWYVEQLINFIDKRIETCLASRTCIELRTEHFILERALNRAILMNSHKAILDEARRAFIDRISPQI